MNRQPTDIDRSAPIVVALDRYVSAPATKLWRLHTDVANWPRWHADIGQTSITGPFEPGTSFTWKVHGLDEAITSTIHQVTEGRETLWSGPAMGIDGFHRWLFQSRGAGTKVITEESWSGDTVDGQRDQLKATLQTSLERWLDALKTAAEKK